jgi:hypothetical protein
MLPRATKELLEKEDDGEVRFDWQSSGIFPEASQNTEGQKCILSLFPQMKNQLKGCHLKNATEIQVASECCRRMCTVISGNVSKELYNCWQKCVAAEEQYS